LWCCDKELKIRWPAGAAAVASGPLLSAVGMRLVQHLIPSSCSSCRPVPPATCHLAAIWLPGPSNFPASLTGLKMIMNMAMTVGTEMEMVLRMGMGLMMVVAALDG